MTGFEQYLFDKGYRPFMKMYDKKTGWSYEPLALGRVSQFSTMTDGRLDNRWLLNEDPKTEIIFGLNEANKPPTIGWPRPRVFKEADGRFSTFEDDHMNQLLKTKTPAEVYKIIEASR